MFRRQEGVVLIFGVVLLIALTGVVIVHISLVGSQTKHIGYQIRDAQALYLAEAGLEKAIWRLKYNKDWRGLPGEGDELNQPQYLTPGSGKSYTITKVEDKDLIGTIAEGFSATSSSNTAGHQPDLAIDNNMSTYWESNDVPGSLKGKKIVEEWIYITFPSVVSLDRARFRLDPAYSNQRPVNYTWSVKKETGPWRDALPPVTDNPDENKTDIFTVVEDDVKYLRLLVTKAGDGTKRVIVAEIESPYINIESQGTVQSLPNNLTKTVSQDFLVTAGSPNTITAIKCSWKEK